MTHHIGVHEGERAVTIIIGIDPHKGTHTAVAIDETEQALAEFELAADRCQTMRLLAGGAVRGLTWAVESADGLGKLLAQRLVAEGEHVIDVPATLAAKVRLLGSTKASKNDPNDALSTAIAGLRHCGLRRVVADDTARRSGCSCVASVISRPAGHRRCAVCTRC